MAFVGKEISIKYKLQRVVDFASLPNKGSLNNLYLTNDTGSLYQWDGSAFVLIAAGGGGVPYQPKVVVRDNTGSPYSAIGGDVVLCVMTLGDVVVNLPPAPANKNQIITVKKVGSSANKVVIDGDAAETIDGDLTKEIRAKNNSFTMICDGQNWFII